MHKVYMKYYIMYLSEEKNNHLSISFFYEYQLKFSNDFFILLCSMIYKPIQNYHPKINTFSFILKTFIYEMYVGIKGRFTLKIVV